MKISAKRDCAGGTTTTIIIIIHVGDFYVRNACVIVLESFRVISKSQRTRVYYTASLLYYTQKRGTRYIVYSVL